MPAQLPVQVLDIATGFLMAFAAQTGLTTPYRERPLVTICSVLTVSALLAAVIGKSGQFPLHTWLPDAMAGDRKSVV